MRPCLAPRPRAKALMQQGWSWLETSLAAALTCRTSVPGPLAPAEPGKQLAEPARGLLSGGPCGKLRTWPHSCAQGAGGATRLGW